MQHNLIAGTFNRATRTATCSVCGRNAETVTQGRPGQEITRKCAREVSTERVYMGG